MDEMNIFAMENNGVRPPPPPRVCPRCYSDNTRFCYYNNYNFSQPRYFCKNCRRYWTYGGTLRNIPIGGSGRKAKQPQVDESNSVPRMVQVPNQQVNHALPVLGNQVGSSSSSYAVGNHFGSSSNIHGGVVPNLAIHPTFGPNQHLDFNQGSFGQEYYDMDHFDSSAVGNQIGSSSNIHGGTVPNMTIPQNFGPNHHPFGQEYYDIGSGYPMMNQSFGGYADNYNEGGINQVDQQNWNQFMDHNAQH